MAFPIQTHTETHTNKHTQRHTHTNIHTHAQKKYWSMWKFKEQNLGNNIFKKTKLDLGFINITVG